MLSLAPVTPAGAVERLVKPDADPSCATPNESPFANVVRFTRLSGRRLPAGSYRLRATARAGRLTGPTRTALSRVTR